MDSLDGQPAADDERLGEVIAAYLDAVREGRQPDRREIVAEHPELAGELEEFFANHDQMESLSAPARLPGMSEEDMRRLSRGPATPNARDAATMAFVEGQPPPAEGGPEQGPRRFGDYELIEEIARGGMGVVYKARQRSPSRVVALKMIKAGRLASEADVERFRVEAEAAAALQHPNIVAIFEADRWEGQHYFTMEYVEGQCLADRIAAGPVPPREAAALMRTIAEAVHYAHQRGIIHRDLKPANILLDASGRPRITDFGLAKRVGTGNLTATRTVLGTPAYIAPEQVECAKAVGPAADIYSLGAILFTLLTGRPPISADSEFDAFLQVLETEPESPRRLNRAVNPDLEAVCLKCLAKDPQARYASAQELADDLGRYLNDEPTAARPLGPLGQVRRWARRRPALATTWAALALFYANHLVSAYVLGSPGEAGGFHLFVTLLVVAWAIGAWLFQAFARRPGAGAIVIYGWTTMDVLLFTTFLLVGDGPRSLVLLGYPLLVAGSALRFRIGMVGYVAGVCAAAYGCLLLEAWWFRPELLPPARAVLPFVLSLVLTALIQRHILRRVRRMGIEGNGA